MSEYRSGNVFPPVEVVVDDMRAMLLTRYSADAVDGLAPVIELAAEAHDQRLGLDARPLALHCASVALSPIIRGREELELGLLHDAATPGYSNFDEEEFTYRALASGCSEQVVAAAACFARPQRGWEYDDWVAYLQRNELTRVVKIADSDAAIANFPPASENQFAAWQRTRNRLAANAQEPSDVSSRIAASMAIHPLPDLMTLGRAS